MKCVCPSDYYKGKDGLCKKCSNKCSKCEDGTGKCLECKSVKVNELFNRIDNPPKCECPADLVDVNGPICCSPKCSYCEE